MVYARAPIGWVAAEDAAGRDAVVAFIAGFVDRHALGFVTDEQLLEEARGEAPAVHEALTRYWVDPRPVR